MNRVVLFLVIFLAISCGRKTTLYVPRHKLPFRVIYPEAKRKDGIWVIEGEISGRKKGYSLSDIVGCKIYYSRYSFENPPCEECPVYLGRSKEIRKNVIRDGKFFLELPWVKKEGIYFLRIRLLGNGNSIGPASEIIKIEVRGK